MRQREKKGLSLIDFPDEYICIDVETTGLDYSYNEIIEVSAVHIKNGDIDGKFSSLVKPSYPISDFIQDLTGITNDMLSSAPLSDEVIPQFFDFVGNHFIVGHNVHFDINFTYDACDALGLSLINNFIDTLRIARKLFPELQHHRLADIATHLGIEQSLAHRAEADVLTTIACYEKMRQIVYDTIGVEAFKEKFVSHKSKKYQNTLKSISATQEPKEKLASHKAKTYQDTLKSILATQEPVDETNPVYNKIVVFTGTLSLMGRKDAFQIVANLGGHPENSVTKRTNFLVVGSDEFSVAIKNGKTSKMKKADDYRLKGLDIVTLSEDTFFDMIGLLETEATVQ